MSENAGAAGAQGGGSGNGQHWAAGFQNAELRDFAVKRNWTGPEQVVQSYREYEQMRGAPRDRLLVLPEKEDAAEWADVYKRLGRPEKPEEYGIEGIEPWLQKAMWEGGMPKATAMRIHKAMVEQHQAREKADNEALQQDLQLEQDQLRKEWGGEYETMNRHARDVVARAAKAAGIADMEKVGDIIEAMEGAIRTKLGKNGYLNSMKFFAYLGKNLGEGRFIEANGSAGSGQGSGSGFGMTPDAAMSEFRQLSNDPAFMKLVEQGDAGANAKFERLAKLASPRFSAGGPQS